MRYIWLALLIGMPQTVMAEFRVWCESPDGSRQWSPKEVAGIRKCGEGIKHLSNVPLKCIENGRFDRVNCRVPDGSEHREALLANAAGQESSESAGNQVSQPRNDLSGAVQTIMEHSKAREELIEEVSID